MRMLVWNCNMRFRDKHSLFDDLGVDIFVVQECENPAESSDESYRAWAGDNYAWTGKNKHKGLGVFARDGIEVVPLHWEDEEESLLPVMIRDEDTNTSFTLLAVWVGAPYITRYAEYQKRHIEKYSSDMIIAGDWNSVGNHPKYPKASCIHREVFGELEDMFGLASAYHFVTGEQWGEESVPTFYLYRHIDRPWFFDYVAIAPDRIKSFEILGSAKEWLVQSDHMPMLLEFC